MRRMTLVFWVILTIGCMATDGIKKPPVDEDMAADLAPEAFEVVVVAGEMSAPVADGALELVAGFQGGWHFETNLVARGDVDPTTLNGFFRGRIMIGDDTIASLTAELFNDVWTEQNDGWLAYLAPIVTDTFDYPTQWIGQSADFVYTVTLDDGREVRGSVAITIVDEVDETAGLEGP